MTQVLAKRCQVDFPIKGRGWFVISILGESLGADGTTHKRFFFVSAYPDFFYAITSGGGQRQAAATIIF
jgi:hypothetical protein